MEVYNPEQLSLLYEGALMDRFSQEERVARATRVAFGAKGRDFQEYMESLQSAFAEKKPMSNQDLFSRLAMMKKR